MENGNTFTLLIIFIVKSLQKEQNSTNLTSEFFAEKWWHDSLTILEEMQKLLPFTKGSDVIVRNDRDVQTAYLQRFYQ